MLISFSLSNSCYSEGYKIKLRIEGVADEEVILAHYFNKSIYPDDTVGFDKNGEGIFRGKSSLPQGMYIIYLPSGKYFEIILGEDQDFLISSDTTDFIHHAVIEGSEENKVFFEFQKYLFSTRSVMNRLQEILKNSSDADEKSTAKEKMKMLSNESIDKIHQIVKEKPGLFVSTFLNATLDIEVPEPPVNEVGYVDSAWQYKYYKHHFFDNFNPHDGRLLRTPLYEEKIMNYLEKVVIQIPDTLIKEVDFLLEGALTDSVLFRYLLVTLFNYYGNSNIMGLDAVQVHLAEKYYLQSAWWIDDTFRNELKERVAILKPLIIGSLAPNIELLFVPAEHFKAAENDTTLKSYPHAGTLMKIHDLPAEYTILLFWEANCSHCKKAVPKMYSIYKEQLEPQGIKLISISTLFGEDGKVKWVDFVNTHGLYDWMNAWNPYDFQYKVQYDIRTTPQIFILDKNKKIIGKRIGPEQVPELIEAYRNHFKE
jgi:hypothetical protein